MHILIHTHILRLEQTIDEFIGLMEEDRQEMLRKDQELKQIGVEKQSFGRKSTVLEENLETINATREEIERLQSKQFQIAEHVKRLLGHVRELQGDMP